jgi:hypothetical protein
VAVSSVHNTAAIANVEARMCTLVRTLNHPARASWFWTVACNIGPAGHAFIDQDQSSATRIVVLLTAPAAEIRKRPCPIRRREEKT